METANGLNIDAKGTITAIRLSDQEEVSLEWGKVDDPDAGEYQNTLGIKNAEWVENDTDDDRTYFIYKRYGERYKIYKSDLNPGE